MEDVLSVLGDRRIVLARELTKKFEEYIRGNVSEVVEFADTLKGEMVVIVEGYNQKEEAINEETLVKEIKELLKKGETSKVIVSMMMDKYGLKKNYVYDLVCKNK